MELLIPGLILVALMVYASTRIKRAAAKAFEAETIEADSFVIEKPVGFLNVLNGDPGYAFQAYSKDFGTGETQDLRQATAMLTVTPLADDDGFAAEDEIVSERTEVIDGSNYKVREAKHTEKGVSFCTLSKTVERDGQLYRLEIKRLAETTPDLVRNTEMMVDSFKLR